MEDFEKLANWTDEIKGKILEKEIHIHRNSVESILKQLLSCDPKKRGTIQSILNHEFFKSQQVIGGLKGEMQAY